MLTHTSHVAKTKPSWIVSVSIQTIAYYNVSAALPQILLGRQEESMSASN